MVPLAFTRLGLLLLYLCLLFVLVRVIETLAWYEAGFLATQIIDPFSLSVRKLKNLLDGRGVSYDGVVEKKELTNLVQTSGEVLEGELELLEQEKDTDSESTQFSCGAHFYEEVEDKKDSVWIVQITPYGHVPLLPESTWAVLTRKVASFGIRTGKFDCALDYRFCHRRGWTRSSLILAMPQGNRHKDQVTMVSYTSTNHRDSYILAWVNHQLASKIHTIPDIHDAVEYWLDTTPTDNKYPDKNPVKVSLFSDGPNIPLFYSAVSMKFSGRIKFGHMNVQSRSTSARLNLKDLPSYMVTTPEGLVHYGDQKGQYLKYNVLDLYLRTLYPEANDLLLLCFTIVNSVCVLELFLTPGGVAKRICCFLWVVGKYNLGLLIVWLPLLGLFQFSLMNPVWRLGLKLARLLSQTAFLSQLRTDWIVYSTYSKWLIGSYLAYCLVLGWLKTWRQGPIPESDISSGAWVRETIQQFYNFLLRPSPRFYTQPLNSPILGEGLDVWIERMATPDLWLHEVVPLDYIKDLPTWNYGGKDQWNDPEEHRLEESAGQKQPTTKNQSKLCMPSDRNTDGVNFSPICSWCNGITSDNRFTKPGEKSELSDVKKSISEKLGLGCNKEGNFSKMVDSKKQDTDNSCFNSSVSPGTSRKSSASLGSYSSAHGDKSSPVKLPASDNIGLKSQSDPHKNSHQKYHSRIDDIPLCKCNDDPSHPHTGQSSKVQVHSIGDPWPDSMLECTQCAICLEFYSRGVTLCGLPCGHCYHHQCILLWLNGGKHMCPNCRWPAFKSKKPKLLKCME